MREGARHRFEQDTTAIATAAAHAGRARARARGSSPGVKARGTGPVVTEVEIAGRYRVVAPIASGGMGDVLLARDRWLERFVAIKRSRPERGAVVGAPSRLQREARVAARLSHRAIVKVFDLIVGDGADYLVMEHVDGPSLHVLHELGPVAIGGALRIAAEIASGLSCAHEHGVVHLDLKLENVLLGGDGQPKITDFGIARCVDLPGDEQVMGTPRAMSPEQADGALVDERSDLFSFGVLIYELVSGRSPFVAPSFAETIARLVSHHPTRVDRLDPRVPRALADLVDQLLAKDPALRPQSVAEVSMRLAAIPR